MPRMYCIKCGADNLETAKFCRKCGENLSGQQSATGDQAEEETRVAVRRSDNVVEARVGGDADTDADEAEIFAISPTLLFVKIGYGLAALGALLLVAFSLQFRPG